MSVTALPEPADVKILALPGHVTDTSLVLREDLTEEDWWHVGTQLKRTEGAVLWWLGDWLRYGERKWGERYAQAVDVTAYEYQTLRDAVWVAGAFPEERRRPGVPWTHHRTVAGLPAEVGDRLLGEAERAGYRRDELSDRVRQEKRRLSSREDKPPLPSEAPPEPLTDLLARVRREERERCAAAICWRCREGHGVWPPGSYSEWTHSIEETESGVTIPIEACPADPIWRLA